MVKKYEMTLAGRKLVFEVGEVANLCNSSVLVKYGETVVLSTVATSRTPREGIDYFPLSVDYQERLYSVGKIPGGFIKREGRPTENAVLAARAIDRPLRPMFPSDLRIDVSVTNTILSVEQDNQPEIAAFLGSAAAVSLSSVPFNGPIAGVKIGLVNDEIIINPDVDQREKSDLDLFLAANSEKITMIEANANEVDDEIMLKAIKEGHKPIKELCSLIEQMQKEVGKEKMEYESSSVSEDLYNRVYDFAAKKMEKALFVEDKNERDDNVSAVLDEINENFEEEIKSEEITKGDLDDASYKLQKKIVRHNILKNKKRVDNRSIDDIRPLSAKVGYLPRTHGSGLFQRGSTQVLTILTLGPLAEVQKLDGLELAEDSKRYIHHYNFPSFSVGDTRPSRGPGRREIGHGALAENALVPVIPTEEEFPYAFRLVSEVLMSNGSTSQGSVCASTLALMDAGVPIKRPVAGISAGLVTDEESDDYVEFMDIQGIEDFFGDMDFKVAGSKKGITAIQVDIKIDGLTYEMIEEAFKITKRGREEIIDNVILKTINQPRNELSEYSPKIEMITIDPDKIREVIGSGGKVINKIIDETEVKIDIEDDGRIYLSSPDKNNIEKAKKMINGIVKTPEPGDVFDATVVKVMDFGAFVEYLPGKEGLVHISKLANERVNKVTDICKEGDTFKVKVLKIDNQGRVNLSRKDALDE